MTTPLTMSAEREAYIREMAAMLTMEQASELLAELDATRARLAKAEAALAAIRDEMPAACRCASDYTCRGLRDPQCDYCDYGEYVHQLIARGLAPERPA